MTNTRYADDILLYAKSLKELEYMTEALLEELKKAGLTMNAGKTKILHSMMEDSEATLNFVEINGDFVKVLHPDEHHRYLGRHLSLASDLRISIEFKTARIRSGLLSTNTKRCCSTNISP